MTAYPPYLPAGFADFWRDNVADAESATLDYQIDFEPSTPHPVHSGQTDPGTITQVHEIRKFEFRGIRGETLHGWVALPEGANAPAPAFLWIAPYGRESVLPNQYGTRDGYVSLSFNFFGSDAFLQAKYSPRYGYFSEGILERRTWVFRTMFQNAVLASRVLADLPQVDPQRIGSMGMSQGGGISIWLGAWVSRIRAICADMPFLGAMHETLLKNVYRYPLKEILDYTSGIPEGQERALSTIAFFDTLNQASVCSKPTLVSVGLKDPAVKPIQARSIYEALPGEKKLIEYDWGHDWHPDMVANNENWLANHL